MENPGRSFPAVGRWPKSSCVEAFRIQPTRLSLSLRCCLCPPRSLASVVNSSRLPLPISPAWGLDFSPNSELRRLRVPDSPTVNP
ncbi:hypothetical protein DAI22_03g250300 [Oryza sativa Japonica Group]|nr:hypothetical protein DAI22_03g250300 [Oryza sativa Japonica Group]